MIEHVYLDFEKYFKFKLQSSDIVASLISWPKMNQRPGCEPNGLVCQFSGEVLVMDREAADAPVLTLSYC